MEEQRVRLIDPSLSASLGKASSSQLRAAKLAACFFAIQSTQLWVPVISKAVEILERDEAIDSMLHNELESFVNELDEKQWDLQDALEEGKVDEATYITAFKEARAANAVYVAFNSDPFWAAADSVYEAFHTTDNRKDLQGIIGAALASASQPE